MRIINVTDLNDICLSVYKDLNESQLRHYYEPDGGIFIAESLKVIERAISFPCIPESVLVEKEKIDNAEFRRVLDMISKCHYQDGQVIQNENINKEQDIPIYVVEHDKLSQITGYNLTGGILCAMRRPSLRSAGDMIKDLRRIAIIDTVVNPTNIGAIFRSAAAFNIEAVLLTKGCCDPLSRRAIRVSMGNVFQIPWTYFNKNGENCSAKDPVNMETDTKNTRLSGLVAEDFDLLHEYGFRTVAMALKDDSIRLDDEKLKNEEKLAIILGNEGDGLSDLAIGLSDYKVIIPMAHEVDSLNVAAASAVAFWELARL